MTQRTKWLIFVALVGLACDVSEAETSALDEGWNRNAELESVFADYLECAASEDDCSSEQDSFLEREDEISWYAQGLNGQSREQASFRASATANCPVGQVTCSGGVTCTAQDNVGCACYNANNQIVNMGTCFGGGDDGEGDGGDGGGDLCVGPSCVTCLTISCDLYVCEPC